MKIAFFHELHFGGARRVVGEYGKVFKKYHDVTLYYLGSKREDDFEDIFPETKFYPYNSPTYQGGNWKIKLYKDFIEPIRLYFRHKKIAYEIDKNNYDFIFVHPSQYTHAPFILRFLKTPTLYYCQEPLRIAYDPMVTIPTGLALPKKSYEYTTRKIKTLIDSANIKKAKVVLSNCDYTKDNIKNAYEIDSYVCYLAVDPNLFHPIKIKKQYDLLFVGADVWMEGYDTLLEINRLLNNRLKIFIVKKKKGKYISDEDLVRKYNSSKLVVVLGRFDPFSMIPLEAMACQVPPIVVKEGGPIEAIEDGVNGFLLPRKSELFAKKIDELLSNSSLIERIGKNGRSKVLSYWTWEESYRRVMVIVRKSNLIQ